MALAVADASPIGPPKSAPPAILAAWLISSPVISR